MAMLICWLSGTCLLLLTIICQPLQPVFGRLSSNPTLQDIMRSRVAYTRPRSPAKADAMKVSGGRSTPRTLGAPSLRLPTRTLNAAVVSPDANDDEDATSQELGSGTYVDAPLAPQLSEDVLVHTLQEDKRSRVEKSCCRMGKVAAAHDLHCNVQLHVEKLKFRIPTDKTRHTHSGLIRPKGRLPIRLRIDFRRCIISKPLVFHKCCYGYTSARNDRLRWMNQRKGKSVRSHDLAWRHLHS